MKDTVLIILVLLLSSFAAHSQGDHHLSFDINYPIPVSKYTFKNSYVGVYKLNLSYFYSYKEFTIGLGLSNSMFAFKDRETLKTNMSFLSPYLEFGWFSSWNIVRIKPSAQIGYSFIYYTNKDIDSATRRSLNEGGVFINLNCPFLFKASEKIYLGPDLSYNLVFEKFGNNNLLLQNQQYLKEESTIQFLSVGFKILVQVGR